MQITIPNKNKTVKLNSICTIMVCDFRQENSLVVPSKIIQQDGNGYFVYSLIEKANAILASKTYIEIGHSYEGSTLVVSGIKPNEEIITEGYNEVSNNALIKVYNSEPDTQSN